MTFSTILNLELEFHLANLYRFLMRAFTKQITIVKLQCWLKNNTKNI